MPALTRPLLLAALFVSVLGATAHAQWAWRDKDGRRIYSDTPPPASVPDRDILQQPATANRGPAPLPELPPATPEGAKPPVPPPARMAASSPADRELEARRRQAEEAEAARKKAAAEQQAQARAENCQRARQAMATLDSGMRIAQVSAKGEREILDDAGRLAERQRIQRVLDADCGTTPR